MFSIVFGHCTVHAYCSSCLAHNMKWSGYDSQHPQAKLSRMFCETSLAQKEMGFDVRPSSITASCTQILLYNPPHPTQKHPSDFPNECIKKYYFLEYRRFEGSSSCSMIFSTLYQIKHVLLKKDAKFSLVLLICLVHTAV